MHVWFPGLSLQTPIESAAVKLDSGSVVVISMTRPVLGSCTIAAKGVITLAIKNKVMIKTKSELQLFIFVNVVVAFGVKSKTFQQRDFTVGIVRINRRVI